MAELLEWWNLVFVLAFFFALVYAVLNAIGLAAAEADIDADIDVDADADVDLDADVDMDVDVDADVDVDVDADVDMDVDADVDVEADVDVDADADVEADVDQDISAVRFDAEVGILEEALSFFGIGKVPLSVIIMTFLIGFSVTGWAANTLLKGILITPVLFFPVSCFAALFCGLTLTKLLAGTLGRIMKPVETSAVRGSSLAGCIGRASLPVTDRFGTALVHDRYGSLHKVMCKVAEGAETVPKGRHVLLVRYVRPSEQSRGKKGHYLIEPYDRPEE